MMANDKNKEKTPRKNQNTNVCENFCMIWEALRNKATRTEPLLGSGVHKAMVEIYGEHAVPVVDTVRNILRSLTDNPERYNSPIQIKCLAKKSSGVKNSYRFLDYTTYCDKLEENLGRDLKAQERPQRYYYLENPLNDGQWRALMDMIRFSPWISQEDTQDILTNFRQLGGLPFSNDQARHQFKRGHQSQFDMIDKIDRGIKLRKQVEITYGNHILQKNNEGKLVPRLIEKKDKSKYLVSPLSMIWSTGSYYLVAFYKNHYIHLRVDRIIAVSIPKENFEYPANFVITEYRESCPFMYGGDKTNVTFTCEPTLLNQVMDHFGTNAQYFLLENGKLEVTVHATESGVKLFALLNQQHMEITKPITLREEIRKIMEETLKKYKATTV